MKKQQKAILGKLHLERITLEKELEEFIDEVSSLFFKKMILIRLARMWQMIPMYFFSRSWHVL